MHGQGHNPSVCANAQPAPFTQGGLFSTPINWRLPMRADGEHRPLQNGSIGHSAPEGANGEEAKSVKKRAALLHVLAFWFFDHRIGVLRGEQP